jgi:hypothetical protein
LIALAVVWAAVVVLAAAWGVVCWREHRPERTGPVPAHRPRWGPQLRALSVEEIRQRLITEAAEAALPPRPARKIEVRGRATPPSRLRASGGGPDTEPFDPFAATNEDDNGAQEP